MKINGLSNVGYSFSDAGDFVTEIEKEHRTVNISVRGVGWINKNEISLRLLFVNNIFNKYLFSHILKEKL